MAFSDLNDIDKKLYEYIKENDFEANPWSTSKAAKALELKEADVYEALASLSRNIKNNIYIHYSHGAIRISAE